MRTTLDIDDDVLAAAKRRAAEENTTAGKVISDLVRKALTQAAANIGSAELRQGLLYEDGWYVRPSRGGLITNELIERIEDELDREDARPAGRERASGTDG
jgi:Arc/MetJ family transcription regulator